MTYHLGGVLILLKTTTLNLEDKTMYLVIAKEGFLELVNDSAYARVNAQRNGYKEIDLISGVSLIDGWNNLLTHTPWCEVFIPCSKNNGIGWDSV